MSIIVVGADAEQLNNILSKEQADCRKTTVYAVSDHSSVEHIKANYCQDDPVTKVIDFTKTPDNVVQFSKYFTVL